MDCGGKARGAKILTSTWAMKKKANGVRRARLNGRGYEQVDGIHYDSSSIHAPVTNDVTVRIVLTLALMAGWLGQLIDVDGAFLYGRLRELLFMKVLQGFKKYYEDNDVLLLGKSIYGTKQAASTFWTDLVKCMKDMGHKRNKVSPCLYYK